MNPEPTSSFKDLGIPENILAVLTRNNFVTPTPIQHKVIPLGITGKDIIGIAQTGTGKTLAFGIPMISRLLANTHARGLVVLPTRELALQVDETMRKIGYALGISTCVLIGGDSMTRQMRELKRDPSIIIATPGRILDHMKQGRVKLDRTSIVVLDEADHMFDIGFAPQVRDIMKKVPKVRQTMLFSATMPDAIAKLALEHMELPLRIEMAPQGTAAKTVDQEIIIVKRPAKFNLLVDLLKEQKGVPVLVFTRTKHGAKDAAAGLRNLGITATEIHSNRSLGQRKEALEGFKQHRYQVLVATDIAARGIDVKDIGLVINYDLPEQSEDYVHRIGRTGRAGKTGKAISFATPEQKYDITAIERLMKRTIPTRSHEGAAMGQSTGPRAFRGNFGSGRGRFGRGAPPGAFKIHTNQPFKGGAPKAKPFVPGVPASLPARQPFAPAKPAYSPKPSFAPRPAYSPRPAYGARPYSPRPFNKGAFGSKSNPRATGPYRGPIGSTPQTRVSSHGPARTSSSYQGRPSYGPKPLYSPKPSYSSRPSYSPKPAYGGKPSYSPRPYYGAAPRPAYSPRPASRPAPGYGTASYGSRPGHSSAGSSRPAYGPKPAYGAGRPSYGGKPSYNSARPSYGAKPAYGRKPNLGAYGGPKSGGYKGGKPRSGGSFGGGRPRTGGSGLGGKSRY